MLPTSFVGTVTEVGEATLNMFKRGLRSHQSLSDYKWRVWPIGLISSRPETISDLAHARLVKSVSLTIRPD